MPPTQIPGVDDREATWGRDDDPVLLGASLCFRGSDRVFASALLGQYRSSARSRGHGRRVARGFPGGIWVPRLSRLVAEARACASAVGAPAWEAEVAEVGFGSPFVDVWLPVLRRARRQLTEASPACREWLSDESIQALKRHLVSENRSGRPNWHSFGDFRTQVPTPSGSADGYVSYVRHLFASRFERIFRRAPGAGPSRCACWSISG